MFGFDMDSLQQAQSEMQEKAAEFQSKQLELLAAYCFGIGKNCRG